jgi:hypothetical protein
MLSLLTIVISVLLMSAVPPQVYCMQIDHCLFIMLRKLFQIFLDFKILAYT